MSKYRNICFTINNYTNLEIINTKALYRERCKYMIIGYEVGESGTPHIQGYVEFNGQLTLKKIKWYIPRAHIEPRRGKPQEASDYCKKDGKFEEMGEISKQGDRTDLQIVAAMVKDGCPVAQVAEEYPDIYIKYSKGVSALRTLLSKPRNEKPSVLWIHGPTGTGKTKFFYDRYEEDSYVWTPIMGNWFDGYDGQENVLFDDFRGELPFGHLLILLDRYRCTVQVKGGTVQFKPKNIVITSPYSPYDLYSNQTNVIDRMDQLTRRIDNIVDTTHSY